MVLQDLGPKLLDWKWISNNLSDEIIPALEGHIYLSFTSVAIALLISLPTGILVSRYRKLYPPVTFLTGLLFSIPSLAAFALLVTVPGIGLGPRAVIIALVAYSLLVLIRNVVAGMDSVPEETKDAARGMGLTSRQILFRVELPLALPIIVAGVRVATVTTIGIASLAALVGAGGLGDLVFTNLQNSNYDAVLGGGIVIGLLAVLADVLLLVLQTALNRGRGPLSTA
jgi:osmoprotectant transport system permease protein